MAKVYLYSEDCELGGIDVIDYLAEHLTAKQIEKKKIPLYMKPKLRYEKNGQFPYRCPICWEKWMYKEPAEQHLEKCWKGVPEKVWRRVEFLKMKPTEIGSWQWDLDEDHRNYCAVGYFAGLDNKVSLVYATNIHGRFETITQKELLEIMEAAEVKYLFQCSKNELPKPLRKYADLPKKVRPPVNDRFRLLLTKEAT